MQKKYEDDLKEFFDLAVTRRGSNVDSEYPDEFYHLNFYQLHNKDDLEKYIKFLNLEKKDLDDFTFNYYVNCIIKYMLGNLDAHTSLIFPKLTKLPYSLKFVEGDLYINYSFDKYICKAKILGINGVNIFKLIEFYEKAVPYGTKEHFYSEIERNFRNLEILYSIPIFKRLNDEVIINTDKGILKINLSAINEFKSPKTFIPYKKIDNILIFRYSACNHYFEKIIDELITYLKDDTNSEIDTFVLDLRNNGGGLSSIIRPLISYLETTNLKLYTVVNRGVFSSGRWAIIDMQKIGSQVIGEQIGTPINCFGYALKSKALANTLQQPIFSKVYWYLDEDKHKMQGIFTREKLCTKKKDLLQAKYLKLDYEIKETKDAFVNDIDLSLNFILNQKEITKKNLKI